MERYLKARETEKTYYNKIKNNESADLLTMLKEHGYKSLMLYKEDKQKYRLSQIPFTFFESSFENYLTDVNEVFESNSQNVVFLKADRTFVFTGREKFNDEYCRNNNIPILDHYGPGGTIVVSQGDFAFGISCHENCIGPYFLLALKNILQKYTSKKIQIHQNDIIMNGKKIAGITQYQKKNLFITVAYFSFSNKNELIKNICTKPTLKQPSYIDFMTSEDLKKELKIWLKNPFI